jgi:hypothetical protein
VGSGVQKRENSCPLPVVKVLYRIDLFEINYFSTAVEKTALPRDLRRFFKPVEPRPAAWSPGDRTGDRLAKGRS